MTAINSAATGNWNAGTTWAGGSPPGLGDTAVILSGHTVTVTVNTTVGASTGAATLAAITVTGPTGKLIIGAGITLVVRGDLLLSDAPFTMNAGAILEFDASATAPTTTNYVFKWGTSGTNTNVIITISGTSGAHCQIRANAGGGNATIDSSPGRNDSTITWCDFTRMGTATLGAIESSDRNFTLDTCSFDGGGRIILNAAGATNLNRLLNVTMRNTLGTYALQTFGAGQVAMTTGTRTITGCVFDKVVSFEWRDWTVSDTIFDTGTGTSGPIGSSQTNPWAAFTNNLLIWGSTANEATIQGSVSNCYCLAAKPQAHFLTFSAGSLSITGTVFELTNAESPGAGDCTMPIGAAAPATYTLEGNIGLPNPGNGCAGTLVSLLGNANTTMRIRHNTWFIGGQPAVSIGETYGGHTGLVAEVRDNLFWDVAPTDYKVRDLAAIIPGGAVDVVAATNCHHNAGYNHLLPGTNGKGYSGLNLSSGSPGANDVDGVDPNFVDATRNIAKWDASIAGGAGSVAHAVAELKKRNDPTGYNPAYTIAALVTWVKAGFVPRAAALQAASDSVAPSTGWIGALQGTAAITVDKSRLMLLGVGS